MGRALMNVFMVLSLLAVYSLSLLLSYVYGYNKGVLRSVETLLSDSYTYSAKF